MLNIIPYTAFVDKFTAKKAGGNKRCSTCLFFQPECQLEHDRLPVEYPFIVEVEDSDSFNYRSSPPIVPGACIYFRDIALTGIPANLWFCDKYQEIPKERQFKDTALTDINDDGRPYDGPTLLVGF